MPVNEQQVYDALVANQGGRVQAMKWLRQQGHSFTTTKFLEIANSVEGNITHDEFDDDDEPIVGGTMYTPDQRREQGTAHTYVFTCAQNNTHVIPGFDALLKYCEAKDAELHISRFTYNKARFGKNSVKPGSKGKSDGDDLWYAPEIEPYISDEAVQITPDLVWCGELNILPTRINPLGGRIKNYTRQASAIVPHSTIAMESVPTMKSDDPKFLYSTGCVTQMNYVQKMAGQMAEFHHVFGALVVEVDAAGNWWARQLNFDRDGGFYDLTEYWNSSGLFYLNGVEAITHGDIHWEKRDDSILETVFANGGVVDRLRPRKQFFHDSIDFTERNHHNIKDPHFWHERHVQGKGLVQDEFEEVTQWMAEDAERPFSQHYIIVSNHDQAIEQWLRNTSALFDPANVRFWHELNAYCYQQREQGLKPHVFEFIMYELLKEKADYPSSWHVLREDDSFRILGEIEAALHGHLGPNGARGNPKNLRTVGKANTAHTHSAGIVDGVYTAGVYGKLDMGYNKGLSSWSHSLIVTYPNKKRAILTIKAGRAWRDQ